MNQTKKLAVTKAPVRAATVPRRALPGTKRASTRRVRRGDWDALATDAFGEDWENPRDAEYDRWQEHYGVPDG